ncbi:response regulator transcription factor [Paenibacillus ginsengarvi]|nr:response regulator [Paenibacillus ginsengarvi]
MYEIVIAEDEHWLRSELAVMIERIGEGFTVVGEAVDGEDAWNMLMELWPSILITDIRMPRRDGLDVIRGIDEAGLPIVPIIVSGYDDFAYAQQAVRFGVSEYLLKPVKQEELQEALRRSLKRLGLLQEVNGCLRKVEFYLHGLPDGDAKKRLEELDALLQELRKSKTVHPNSRKTVLNVFSGKWIELIRGMRPDYDPGVPPVWDSFEQTQEYFHRLLEIWSFAVRDEADPNIRQTIRRACDYIASHYMQPLTLVKMAQLSSLSPSYFGYLFKQHTGQPFVAYLNGVRIQKAKALLMEDDIKVYEAAEMVGFVSLPHFNRLFKTATGKTPNDFRKGMGR